jgi:hypothetical protein
VWDFHTLVHRELEAFGVAVVRIWMYTQSDEICHICFWKNLLNSLPAKLKYKVKNYKIQTCLDSIPEVRIPLKHHLSSVRLLVLSLENDRVYYHDENYHTVGGNAKGNA